MNRSREYGWPCHCTSLQSSCAVTMPRLWHILRSCKFCSPASVSSAQCLLMRGCCRHDHADFYCCSMPGHWQFAYFKLFRFESTSTFAIMAWQQIEDATATQSPNCYCRGWAAHNGALCRYKSGHEANQRNTADLEQNSVSKGSDFWDICSCGTASRQHSNDIVFL